MDNLLFVLFSLLTFPSTLKHITMQYIIQNTVIKNGKFLHINTVYYAVLLQTFPSVSSKSKPELKTPNCAYLDISYNAAWVKDTQNSSLWLYPFLMSIGNRFRQICVYMSNILLINYNFGHISHPACYSIDLLCIQMMIIHISELRLPTEFKIIWPSALCTPAFVALNGGNNLATKAID